MQALQIGDELPPLTRVMTRERMRWYADSLNTAAFAHDDIVRALPSIHTDDRLAHEQGLRGIVAEGMITTCWVSNVLYDVFGDAYASGGELTTKFIRPIFEGERLSVHIRVEGVEQIESEILYALGIRCVNENGELFSAGNARVKVPSASSL